MPKLVVFRCDASPEIGGGHVVRCRALAEALRAAGWRIVFATRPQTLAAMDPLGNGGIDVVRLSGPVEREPTEIEAALDAPCDLLIIDRYDWDTKLESACRSFASRILAFDDDPGRIHDADVLLNGTPGIAALDYDGKVPAGCATLLGPGFAPLRPAFQAARRAALVRRGDGAARRILINMGATDPSNHTALALDAVQAAGLDVDLDVVLGLAAPHRAAVAARRQRNAALHVDAGASAMARLMMEADIAIGAAGSSVWERCCLGLPSVAIVAAENQRRNAAALAASGAAAVVDAGSTAMADALTNLARDAEGRKAMAAAAAALCDGRGAWRILLSLLPPLKLADGAAVSLRLLEPSDEALILDWQRHSKTRAFAHAPTAPTSEEHHAWLGRTLTDPARILTVIECDGEPAGVLRLDQVGEGRSGAYVVSILVDPDHYRRRIASAALALARDLLPGVELHAEVYPENAASLRLFHGAGYVAAGGILHVNRPLA